MGYKEMSTREHTLRWIENLAEQELSILRGERGLIDLSSTKDELLTMETDAFLRAIRDHCTTLIEKFNSTVEDSPLTIKLTSLTGTKGFSLCRNSMRLSVIAPQVGVIQMQCDKILPTDFAKSNRTSVMFSGLIEGKFGDFHEVNWFFLATKVDAEQVARHYLTEFIQVSRLSV